LKNSLLGIPLTEIENISIQLVQTMDYSFRARLACRK